MRVGGPTLAQFEVLVIADSQKVRWSSGRTPGTALDGCGHPGEARTGYVRHHGITKKAKVSEIAVIVHERPPGTGLPPS
jgi:hypothetical protein